MFYTNRSTITKTFHGVTFRPGETKEVFGIINDPSFVHSSTRQEPPKCDRSKSIESEGFSPEVSVPRRGRRKNTKESSTGSDSNLEESSEDSDNLDNVVNKEV